VWDTLIFWDAEKTETLTRLHQELARRLNNLREGQLLPVHQNILEDPEVSDEIKESIREFGNPLAGEQERPHITIAKMKTPEDVATALVILREAFSGLVTFTASTIAITEVGPYGSCPRVLEEIPLG